MPASQLLRTPAGRSIIRFCAFVDPGSAKFSLALLAINLVLVVLIFGVLDRGRLISPAYSRLDRRDLNKLRRVATDRSRAQTAGAGD